MAELSSLKDVLEAAGLDVAALHDELIKIFTSEDPVAEIATSTPVKVRKACGSKITVDQAKGLISLCKDERQPAVAPAPAAPAAVAEAAPAVSTPQMASMDVLPAVPDDISFLEMLRVGGVLRIQPVDVISAIKAAIADGVGLYDLPDTIIGRMESFAEEQSEPVGESFWTLHKLVTQRSYGDLLSALGVSGNFVSDKRKKVVLQRLKAELWPALQGFQVQLKAWADAWTTGAANPAMALTLLAMAQVGGAGAPLPPGIMQPPETAVLRDAAEAVINSVNYVFAGTGIPVARALAYDAVRIRTLLEEPTLPAAVGATTRDQMLKALGVDVSADLVRLERNASRYALAIMEVPKVSAGTGEYAYFAAMLQLGASIPWDKLGTGSISVVKKEERPSKGEGFRERKSNETF